MAIYGDALRDADDRLVGRGIALPGARGGRRVAVQWECGAGAAEIVWREVRRTVDPEGGKHVFYRQHLAGGGLDTELSGSEVGVHWMPDGTLLGIAGQQFDAVAVSGCPALSAAEAVEEARERVLHYKGQYAQREPWTMDAALTARLAETKLQLVQIDGAFRAAYSTSGVDADGNAHSVVVDAQDGRLLAITDGAYDNCTPSSTSYVTAYGVPVRPELTNWRTVGASYGPRSGFEGFTHEGAWRPSGLGMRLIVYHGVSSTSGYRCGTRNYTVFPLKATPPDKNGYSYYKYDEWEQIPGHTPFRGRAAGDALWHTYRTMAAFKAMGRNGWDNAGGDARIVVESGVADQGEFIRSSTASTAPADSVRIGRAGAMYSGAASLDLVAHEWGHGVIFLEANFDRSMDHGKELHEGFADVIGQLVEKRAQAGGTGLEQSSDFRLHEDSAVSGYARGAVDDVTGHSWVGPTGTLFFDDRLHMGDSSYGSSPHSTGNMLNVVYAIMSAGGSTDLPKGLNPICDRMSWLPGCDPENAVTFSQRFGPTKAGELFFHAIQHVLTSGDQWTTIADQMTLAAFQKFNTCSATTPSNAPGEQEVVRKAFAGIGYPRTLERDIVCPPR